MLLNTRNNEDPHIQVLTVKPEKESTDWMPEALAARKWGVKGVIFNHSNAHGQCYEVRYEDGTSGWYEPRELKLI